eukprot:scaffold168829_cov17-Tisochrysis_lutea.AAC.1
MKRQRSASFVLSTTNFFGPSPYALVTLADQQARLQRWDGGPSHSSRRVGAMAAGVLAQEGSWPSYNI